MCTRPCLTLTSMTARRCKSEEPPRTTNAPACVFIPRDFLIHRPGEELSHGWYLKDVKMPRAPALPFRELIAVASASAKGRVRSFCRPFTSPWAAELSLTLLPTIALLSSWQGRKVSPSCLPRLLQAFNVESGWLPCRPFRQGLHPNMAPAVPLIIYIILGSSTGTGSFRLRGALQEPHTCACLWSVASNPYSSPR